MVASSLALIGWIARMLLALVLSGFFVRTRTWIKWLSALFIIPWAVPSIPTILSFRFMLNPEWGIINSLIFRFTGAAAKVVVLDRGLVTARYDQYRIDTARDRFLDRVLDKGFVDKRQHFLRTCFGRGKKPGSEPCGREDRLSDRLSHTGFRY